MKKRLLHILFWSVISAAFIGPGTVTTAASAGTGFGYLLIWALLFSTAACYVLQEASSRITAATGSNLGEVIRKKFGDTGAGKWIIITTLISIIIGCAAFEAGNILGAAAGITVIYPDVPVPAITAVIGLISALILWAGTIRQIATFLGFIVALMGVCFVITAATISHDWAAVLSGSVLPAVPVGAEILVLGLIGTTVVPYNIFLGGGLKHSQTIPEMKLSLLVAIGLGGFVSAAILLTGTAISGSFSFENLAAALTDHLGGWARWLLGIGLFGAGISSALTAALAAAVTARGLLSKPGAEKWNTKSKRFRMVWTGVLAFGLLFGLLRFQPVPVIILAQALNGIILPVIAIILLLVINDPGILPRRHQNGRFYNLVTLIVVYLTFLIGISNFFRAFSRLSGFEIPDQSVILILSGILFLLMIIPVFKNIFKKDP